MWLSNVPNLQYFIQRHILDVGGKEYSVQLYRSHTKASHTRVNYVNSNCWISTSDNICTSIRIVPFSVGESKLITQSVRWLTMEEKRSVVISVRISYSQSYCI